MMLGTLETIRQFVMAKQRWATLEGKSLEQFQDLRAQQLVRWVHDNSSFYRQHWEGHDLEQWRELPIVDKSLMMANFTEFNTRGITRENAVEVALRAERDRNFSPTLKGCTVGLSSGTSGHRGLFLVSPLEQASWAGVILARALPRLRIAGERIAFFLRSNSNLYEQVGRGRWLQFRYFDLMTPLEDSVRALNTFQPSILVAPPSMLELLACERLAGRLKVKPDGLISVAEVLEPQDRDRLEGVFQAPVRQIYQATEGLLAVSCQHSSLHLQEDIVAVQLEPVSSSESRFTPIITDLWRRTQPITRYRLNDVISLENKLCTCGSSWRVIRQIEGRSDDVLEFEQISGGLRPFFPDTIRRAILLASSHILEYEAVQERPGQLRVHLEVEPNSQTTVRDSVTTNLAQTLEQYGCRPAQLEIVFGLPARAPNVKRRRIRRT
jgi:putative adenylate-forming enzyme